MSAQELEKIAENIHQLEQMKANGVMPADLADASIAALKKELATYRAELIGGGAIAQGDGSGSTAVGKGGVLVSGNVHANSDIILGEQTINYYGPEPRTGDEALSVYCRALMQSVSSLPLRGVDVRANDPVVRGNNIKLASVYLDLDTTSVVKKDNKQDKRGRK
jgi:hypothetical protein